MIRPSSRQRPSSRPRPRFHAESLLLAIHRHCHYLLSMSSMPLSPMWSVIPPIPHLPFSLFAALVHEESFMTKTSSSVICHCHFCDWYRVLLAASKTVHVGCSENMPSVREMPQWTKLAKMWVGQSGQKVGSIAAQCVRTRGLGGHQVDAGSWMTAYCKYKMQIQI